MTERDAAATERDAAATAAAAAEFLVGAEGADNLASAAAELRQRAAATLARFTQRSSAVQQGSSPDRAAAASACMTLRAPGAPWQGPAAANGEASHSPSGSKRPLPECDQLPRAYRRKLPGAATGSAALCSLPAMHPMAPPAVLQHLGSLVWVHADDTPSEMIISRPCAAAT